MDNTPETAELLAELYERAELVTELDGPQIEAWASGLFPLFDDDVTAAALVAYCAEQQSAGSAIICAAIGELLTGIDPVTAEAAAVAAASMGPEAMVMTQIGTSVLVGAWMVEAPFGRSIVLGYDNPNTPERVSDEDEPIDLGHSILVEISRSGALEDLQLTGPPGVLLDEAAASDDRVSVAELDPSDAATQVVAAWPADGSSSETLGPGFAANQQFVRRRLLTATDQLLPAIAGAVLVVDIQRGLDDIEFARANQAALSTLQAAVGLGPEPDPTATATTIQQTWVSVIRGDAGDLSPRERDALLWLEWADWLGAGIGLCRSGVAADATGAAMVDYVNRCPEVSSTIEKADRDYAEWAFDVALDLLADVGAIEDGRLTQLGFDGLGPAMVVAWSS